MEVISALQMRLTEQQIAELQGMYYLGRPLAFPIATLDGVFRRDLCSCGVLYARDVIHRLVC